MWPAWSSSTDIIALPGMKKGRIVASSEGRKAERTRPVPEAMGLPMPPRERGLCAGVCVALKGVLVADEGAGLVVKGAGGLLVEDDEDGLKGEEPALGVELVGPRVVVELVGEGEEGGERVELVLALEDGRGLEGWVHAVRLAVGCDWQAARRWRLEGVAVGRGDDVLGLRVDGADQEVVNRLVLLRKVLVLLRQLIRRVPQPLGVDVPRDDEALRTRPFAFLVLRLVLAVDMPFHGRVEGVWEGILEYAREVLVHHLLGHVFNHFLHQRRHESPTVLRGSLEW
ncbi:hypothetical protein MRB53_037799 [Persea americana]|nr:hypothetical protein MRB53_037799 [Persea americana]